MAQLVVIRLHRIEYLRSNGIWLFILALLGTITSMVRFAYVYPDSNYYLALVEFFRGNTPFSETYAPFNNRILLPLLAAALPIHPAISFGIMNTLFTIFLSFVFFILAEDFGFPGHSCFLSSSLCTISWIVAYYGSAVLVDAGAVLCLSLAILVAKKGYGDFETAVILLVGVLFKEIALIGILAVILWEKKIRPLTIMLPSIAYVVIRFFTAQEGIGFVWYFHLESFTTHLEPTIKTLGLTLGPFMIMFLISLYFRNVNREVFTQTQKWLILIGLACSISLLMGLFFAYFDSRFVWPLYPALVPIVAYGFENLAANLKSLSEKKTKIHANQM